MYDHLFNNVMEFKKIKVTAVNLEMKKSVTFTVDMEKVSMLQTADAVRKALEMQILESKVFSKEDLPKLKYQGRKEVLDEWKAIRPNIVENGAKRLNEMNGLVTPEKEIPQYGLDRFLAAQESFYPIALEEIRSGRKMSHWIWYIFPQQKGLGHSYNSTYYGLDGIGEARQYLAHPILGTRLREISEALLEHRGRDIYGIMGSDIDAIKLETSMKLFDGISPNDVFDKVLRTFFD